jgi:hypothetical protein
MSKTNKTNKTVKDVENCVFLQYFECPSGICISSGAYSRAAAESAEEREEEEEKEQRREALIQANTAPGAQSAHSGSRWP